MALTKTLSEAQAIVDAEITQAQADWDALPAEQKDTISWFCKYF